MSLAVPRSALPDGVPAFVRTGLGNLPALWLCSDQIDVDLACVANPEALLSRARQRVRVSSGRPPEPECKPVHNAVPMLT